MNKKRHKITFMILLLIAALGSLSAQDDMAILMPNEASFCKTITPSAHNTIVKERAVEAYNLAMGIIGVKNIGSGVVHFAKELPDNVITLIKNNQSIRAQVAEKYLDWKVAIANFDDLSDADKQLLAKQYETWQSLEIADKTADGSRFLTWEEAIRLRKMSDIVRGISKADLIASIKGLTPNTKLADDIFELWRTEKWAEMEELFKLHNLNNIGGVIYPPNNGAISVIKKTLNPSDFNNTLIVDRYGSTKGYYVSPASTPFSKRALPASYAALTPNRYKIIRSIEIEEGLVIPWFGQEGKGMQYKLEKELQWYIDEKFIEIVK